MILTFPYRRELGVSRSPANPGVPVHRPMILLQFRGPTGETFVSYALVDTGADDCIAPASIAKRLGVSLKSKVYALYGADGKPIKVRYGEVELTLANKGGLAYSWKTLVGFQDEGPNGEIGRVVLGRAGGLDLFQVTFNGPRAQLIIETPIEDP